MNRPEQLWRAGFVKIGADLREADGKLQAIAEDADAPGLAADDVLALVWRETDLPTCWNGAPPSDSKAPWLMAAEYHPLGKVFTKGSPWMERSCGRILQIAGLLERDSDRVRCLIAAYGESMRDVPYSEPDPAPVWSERAMVARRLLQGVCGALSSPQTAWTPDRAVDRETDRSEMLRMVLGGAE